MRKSRMLRKVSFVLVFCLLFTTVVPLAFAENSKNVVSSSAETPWSVPPILITEIVPTTIGSTHGSATNDAFEYIEIYNNTNQPIDFSDYKILYRYPTSPDNDLTWVPYKEDIVIQPGKTLVLWGQNSANVNETVDTFNAHFGTNLVEDVDIVKMDVGMHSSRTRWLIVATNSGHELVSAAYNLGMTDAAADLGVVYRYPEPGSNEMIKISSRERFATPGSVDPGQVPDELLLVEDDVIPPVIEDLTAPTALPGTPITFTVDARDENLVKNLSLFYKKDNESEYTEQVLRVDREDGYFRYTLDVLDAAGAESIDYYYVGDDGTNETTSEVYTLDITYGPQTPRLNAEDGQIVSGTYLLKAGANGYSPEHISLRIDGEEAASAHPGLEESAFFVFEVNGFDNYFKNTIQTEGEIIRLIDYRVVGFETIVTPVETIKSGVNTISIVAGSQVEPYNGAPHENLDDFDVRNVRLVLADGTVLRDPLYSDPTLVLDMGDNGRYLPVVDFEFTVPAANATAKVLEWDTTQLSDGEYVVEAVTPDHKSTSVTVVVDNTGPSLNTTVQNGQSYKGEILIDVSAADTVTGVDSVEAILNGEPIELPYATSSGQLPPGEHELVITATDLAGNLTEEVIRFSTAEEHPHTPVLIQPANGESVAGFSPALAVTVSDPSADPLEVSFYQGYKYNASRTDSVTWYAGAAATEPPDSPRPHGERMLTDEEISRLTDVNDQYVTVDATTEFPYLRMEVEVDTNVQAADEIHLLWEGHSLPGRKVTMYAWNVVDSTWDTIDLHVADSEEDFTLSGDIVAGDYLDGRTLNILIQDELELGEDYQYTFVWMSDSQYYTQTLSHVMQAQIDWIAEMKDELNIEYVFHTGDIVENAHQEYQWIVADRLMGELEATGIPNGVLAGNHDVLPGNDYTMYSRYFGASRYEHLPHYGESYKDNRGHYDLISSHGNDYIMVYMGWGEGEEEVAWLNDVLARYPERQAILSFHDYLRADGTRSTTGNYLFENVVVPNPNVIMVLSGHYTGASLLTDDIDDDGDGVPDRRVFQMLSDYQNHNEGGDGYMKLFHFDTTSDTLHVRTYSPYKDDYNWYDPVEHPWADEYTLSLDLEPKLKRVATNYVDVSVYSKAQPISQHPQTASGSVVETVWQGLAPNQTYHWYAEAKDEFGGRTVSPIWSFTTGEDADLPAPSDLRAEDITATSVKLVWDAVVPGDTGELSYNVYLDGQKLASVTEAVYHAEGLTPATKYTFHVTAKDEWGNESAPSEVLEVTTLEAQVELSQLQQTVQQYIDSGELRRPLAQQLTNRLETAERMYSRNMMKQAIKHIEQFKDRLNHHAMSSHVDADAKAELNRLADALLNAWQ
ncbi:FIMAH domain-containing protein [Paenibacillus senegalensis]|uniref:FIMAH domain-containing protein n=1 Tax=Paenibacillus senegalensis TaxID=1465766 RepID=UPI0002F4F11D|nr:lamin tail domain-containing protein [Paenibacillus senegalensis]